MTTAHHEPNMIGFELTHSLLNSEIARLAQAFATPIEPSNVPLVEDHLRLVAAHLVRHHQEEDAFHWPLLERRAPEMTEILTQLEAEHGTIEPQLAVILDRTAPRSKRSRELSQLATTLADHFDDEDRVIMPMLRCHISAEEQAASMERSRRKIPPADELRVLSMMLAAATEEQCNRMLTALTPEVIQLWATIGKPQLAEIHRRLT